MCIEVVAINTPEGIILQTNDVYRDTIGGPVPTSAAAKALAKELDLSIVEPARRKYEGPRIKNMQPGALFRVADYWYRIVRFDGKLAILDVVGEHRQETMPISTEVTEISVLCLRWDETSRGDFRISSSRCYKRLETKIAQ